MDLSLGWGTQIELSHDRLGVTAPPKGGESLVRIMLNDIPEGKYKVSLTYYMTPDGCDFSVWNRQKPLTEWQNTFAQEEKKKDRQELGIINITPQTNSISIHVRKTEAGNKFHFDNLYLKKMND